LKIFSEKEGKNFFLPDQKKSIRMEFVSTFYHLFHPTQTVGALEKTVFYFTL